MIIDIRSVLAQFDRLKEEMGIEDEPDIDWPEFQGRGVEVGSLEEILPNREQLLTWRGELCILYIREQQGLSGSVSSYKYHLTECRTVAGWRERWTEDRYVVTNRADDQFVACRRDAYGDVGPERLVTMKVCKNCLSHLDWDGFRDTETWKRDRIVNAFKIQRYLDVYQDRTTRAARRKPAPSPAPKPVKPPQPRRVDPTSRPPRWAGDIKDEDFRAALLHLSTHGRLYEADLSKMVGGARRARRFNRYCDFLPDSCPFTVQISTDTGQKIYRARRR